MKYPNLFPMIFLGNFNYSPLKPIQFSPVAIVKKRRE